MMSKMLLVFACSALLFVRLWGQSQAPLLQRNISLNYASIKLEDALLLISKETDFNLSYNSAIIPVDSIIKMNFDNENPIKILKTILPQNIEIKHSGNNVALLRKAKAPKKNRAKAVYYTITGQVLDSQSKNPIEEATVLNLLNSKAILSDSIGAFKMVFSSFPNQLSISVSKINFADTILLLKPSNQKIVIYLEKIKKIYSNAELARVHTLKLNSIEYDAFGKMFIPKLLLLNSENIEGFSVRDFQASLTPGLSSNFKIAGTVKNVISLNVIGGYGYGVSAVELGGAFNMTRNDVHGVQLAGAVNLVGRNVDGLQIAGAFNHTKGYLNGLQLSGIANTNLNDINGLQIAGLVNDARENVAGVQLAGALNLTKRKHKGLQMAGIANKSGGDCSGLQLAGVYNQSNHFRGAQISGIANIADTLNGAQIGLFNKSKVQNGFQFGLINLNDHSNGISVGLLNIAKKNGFFEAALSANELLYGNIQVYLGTARFYNIFSAGLGNGHGGYGLGFGSQKQLKKNRSIQFEYTANWLQKKAEEGLENYGLHKMNVLWGWRLAGKSRLVFGPSANLLFYPVSLLDRSDFRSISPYKILNLKTKNQQLESWIGLYAGLKFDLTKKNPN